MNKVINLSYILSYILYTFSNSCLPLSPFGSYYPQVEPDFPAKEIRYIGRPASAVTATGCYFVHKEEEQWFLREALSPPPPHPADCAGS
jgi:hypothetical protein